MTTHYIDRSLTRRAIHPNDTHDGESSGNTVLKPSKNPFHLECPSTSNDVKCGKPFGHFGYCFIKE